MSDVPWCADCNLGKGGWDQTDWRNVYDFGSNKFVDICTAEMKRVVADKHVHLGDADMTNREWIVQMVDIDSLIDSPQQPDTRVGAIGPLNHLKNSIKTIGLQYPPLVLPKPGNRYQVVDGHRRIAAMKQLNMTQVPVLVTEGNSGDLFAGVSGNVAKMKSYEWILVHLKSGVLPSGPNRNCILSIEKHMGREFLQKLADKRQSPNIWNVANRVLKYVGFDENERVPVLEWLHFVGSTEVGAWMAGDNKPDELRNAFWEKRNPSMKTPSTMAA